MCLSHNSHPLSLFDTSVYRLHGSRNFRLIGLQKLVLSIRMFLYTNGDLGRTAAAGS